MAPPSACAAPIARACASGGADGEGRANPDGEPSCETGFRRRAMRTLVSWARCRPCSLRWFPELALADQRNAEVEGGAGAGRGIDRQTSADQGQPLAHPGEA